MIRITNREIINAVAGCIYEMHPYHLPEGIGEIIKHLRDVIDNLQDCSGSKDNVFKIFEFENFNEFEKWLKNILEQVPEYFELNVSRKLKDENVKAGDTENSGITFTCRYDSYTLDSRYTDFIDLDALLRNICVQIEHLQIIEDDCFLCKYAENYGSMHPSKCDICENCICNPKHCYNREPHPLSLKPHSEWTKEEKELYSLD